MLSIIFPIRNEERNLQNIIDIFENSIINFNYEILFINDFSQDNSLDTMRRISNNNDKVKFFDNKN